MKAAPKLPKEMRQVHEQTRNTYNTIADLYHTRFHNEMEQKPFDQSVLKEFCSQLPPNALVMDAGCGPCGHVGKFIKDLGYRIIGVDISDECITQAIAHNPTILYYRMDLADMTFSDGYFDAIVVFYAIIDTPKQWIPRLFQEFYRVLKPKGRLLVVVKEGTFEGMLEEILGTPNPIFYAEFSTEEIRIFFENSGFTMEKIESRDPYAFEINASRIYACGRKN